MYKNLKDGAREIFYLNMHMIYLFRLRSVRHCPEFWYKQLPEDLSKALHCVSFSVPVPQVSGQHRLKSLAHLSSSQYDWYVAIVFLQVQSEFHSGEFWRQASLSLIPRQSYVKKMKYLDYVTMEYNCKLV